MKKVKLAICILDSEYAKRLTGCLMRNYQGQIELHLYETVEELKSSITEEQDVILLANCLEVLGSIRSVAAGALLYLYDAQEDPGELSAEICEMREDGRITFLEKYQEVNRIMDEVLAHVSDEVRQVSEKGIILPKTRILAVYSLSENATQLPFAVTMGSILGEKEQVLLIDMQENSGFSRVTGEEGGMGLEDLLVMAENKSFSRSRLMACIGHKHGMDYIYPAENTECLCEASGGSYLSMLTLIEQELSYDVVILNLGARFQGFFEVLNRCTAVYFMQRKGGLCQWREYEFREELKRKGYGELEQRLTRIEPPVIAATGTFDRLIEQWKWNELGDLIRRYAAQESKHG